MKSLTCTFAVLTFVAAALACDKPFSVFQNGPNAILLLQVKQAKGATLTKAESALVDEYEADRKRYWQLRIKSDPVCIDGVDPHNCISSCKNRPADIVKAAKYIEKDLRYSLPPAERAKLEKQGRELEKKWEKWEYVK